MTCNDWTVYLDERGMPIGFEHATLGVKGGAAVWFDGVVLVDYDGVFELPKGVTQTCKKLGFNMDVGGIDVFIEGCEIFLGKLEKASATKKGNR